MILTGLQRFTAEQATEASQHFLPDQSFDSHQTMIAALAHMFDTSPQDLCQSVLQKFNKLDFAVQTTIADWLNVHGLSRHQYVRSVSSSKAKADSLFVWLAIQCAKQHLNLMHASGIWTSHKSKYMVMTGPTIVLLISGLLSITKMSTTELLDDSIYLAQFKNPLET